MGTEQYYAGPPSTLSRNDFVFFREASTNMKLNQSLLLKLGKKHPPSTMVDLTFRGKDISFKTDEEGTVRRESSEGREDKRRALHANTRAGFPRRSYQRSLGSQGQDVIALNSWSASRGTSFFQR
jgi:hypothetical protein